MDDQKQDKSQPAERTERDDDAPLLGRRHVTADELKDRKDDDDKQTKK